MSPASPSILELLLAPVDGGCDDDNAKDDDAEDEDGDNDEYDDDEDDDFEIVKTHLLHLPEVQSCSTRAGSRSNSRLH